MPQNPALIVHFTGYNAAALNTLAGPGLLSFLLRMRKSLYATKLKPRFAGWARGGRNAVPGAKTEVRVFLGEPHCRSLDPQLVFRYSACHEVRRSGDHRVER